MNFETDLADVVRRIQEAKGWDVFAEVQVRQGDKRADLVCQLGRRIMVIETKLSLSIDVVSQAVRWIGKAHYVVIAVPEPKNSLTDRHAFIADYLKQRGIGLWWVHSADPDRRIAEKVRPVVQEQLHRWADKPAQAIRNVLTPEMRAAAAGAKTGGAASTPFGRTCLKLKKCVAKNPGVTFRQAIESIDHHYSSTRSALSAMALIVRKADVELKDGLLYPKGETGLQAAGCLKQQPARSERTDRLPSDVMYITCNLCHGIVLMAKTSWLYRASGNAWLAWESIAERMPDVTLQHGPRHYVPTAVPCGCHGRQGQGSLP